MAPVAGLDDGAFHILAKYAVAFADARAAGWISAELTMGEWDRRDSGTGWTVSPSFLALIAVLLGLVVLIVARPDFSRWAVFPFVLAGWVVSLCLHEFGHALAAFVCGDRSVRDKGYLTLDPLHYTDL